MYQFRWRCDQRTRQGRDALRQANDGISQRCLPASVGAGLRTVGIEVFAAEEHVLDELRLVAEHRQRADEPAVAEGALKRPQPCTAGAACNATSTSARGAVQRATSALYIATSPTLLRRAGGGPAPQRPSADGGGGPAPRGLCVVRHANADGCARQVSATWHTSSGSATPRITVHGVPPICSEGRRGRRRRQKRAGCASRRKTSG